MLCTLCTKWGTPAFAPQQQPMLVMLAEKHTRNACLLYDPSDHVARGVPAQDAFARAPLWSMMMKALPSGNGHWDPKQADRNSSGQLALSPQVSIFPPPLLGHHRMFTSLLDRSKVIIQPMKDGDGKRTFKLGPTVTMSCHPWDSNSKNKTHQIPCNKTLLFLVYLASKLCGTQWLEDLFRKPSQHNEPPIPGLSQCSKPQVPSNEDALSHEPEPEEATMQSTQEPFACPITPPSIIIIDDMPVEYPPPLPPSTPTAVPSLEIPPIATKNPTSSSPPMPSSPQSHDEAWQEFTNLHPTLMIPQAIVHESINRILLEQCGFLHMIPFVDETH
ncbi:hypothetical protein O181_009694 [Austropuccinia psidii MF-1]|uniref:Uncharacterized protein n=1 Tax=Austropuccinia psidii MF-1 TaxID=1389203 RepID=A0A9Q3BPQ8_9BASI|nr:hypothetical protein [Austropuccinia psidii MF-1]